jgi:signal transduction histidine kinase
VEFLVGDTGHGLPEGDESQVFESFFTTREDGMGQGLSISRSIIEAHGGTIQALRNKGTGATFVVSLPAGQEE